MLISSRATNAITSSVRHTTFALLRGCQKDVPLRGFNKVASIWKHMRSHANNGDKSCKVFMRRQNHMIESVADQRQEDTRTPTDKTETWTDGALGKKTTRRDDSWVRVLQLTDEMSKLDAEVKPALTRNQVLIDPETPGNLREGTSWLICQS